MMEELSPPIDETELKIRGLVASTLGTGMPRWGVPKIRYIPRKPEPSQQFRGAFREVLLSLIIENPLSSTRPRIFVERDPSQPLWSGWEKTLGGMVGLVRHIYIPSPTDDAYSIALGYSKASMGERRVEGLMRTLRGDSEDEINAITIGMKGDDVYDAPDKLGTLDSVITLLHRRFGLRPAEIFLRNTVYSITYLLDWLSIPPPRILIRGDDVAVAQPMVEDLISRGLGSLVPSLLHPLISMRGALLIETPSRWWRGARVSLLINEMYVDVGEATKLVRSLGYDAEVLAGSEYYLSTKQLLIKI